MSWVDWAVVIIVGVGALWLYGFVSRTIRVGRAVSRVRVAESDPEKPMREVIKAAEYSEMIYDESVREWEEGAIDMAMLEERRQGISNLEQLAKDNGPKAFQVPGDMLPYFARIAKAKSNMQAFVESIKASEGLSNYEP